MTTPSLCLSLLCSLALAHPGDDLWPDYRGPGRDGHADAAAVPLHWSEERGVLWKTPIHGRGWSSPVVGEGKVWLTTATPDGKRMSAVRVDLASGKVELDLPLIETADPEPRNDLNSYASPSPVIEPGRVYAHFGTYGTVCLDSATGEELWRRSDLNCDHMMGPGSSPLLHGERLFLNVDGGDVQYVAALDKHTGETLWRTDRDASLKEFAADLRKAYSTPTIVAAGEEQQLLSSGAQITAVYDPEDGSELWRVRHGGFSMSARPVIGKGLVVLNTGFVTPELWAVRLGGVGDVSATHVAWKHRRGVATMASALLVDDLLFLISNGGVASCLDIETGNEHWRKRILGEVCASPVYAGGRVYFLDREGRAQVVAADAEHRVLATNDLDEGFMASPAVVGDSFLLRSTGHLYRIVDSPEGE